MKAPLFNYMEYKKSHLNLIHYALNQGHKVGVYYGLECDLEESESFNAIKEASEACDECVLRIVDKEGESLGVAVLVHNNDDYSVCDHTDNEFFSNWSNQYNN